MRRRGKTHRALSSGYVDAHGSTEVSGDLGAGRSFPVPACSLSEQGPSAILLFPQPPKNADVDGWCAVFSIKILTLLEPSYKNWSASGSGKDRIPVQINIGPPVASETGEMTELQPNERPAHSRNRLDWQLELGSGLAACLRCDQMQRWLAALRPTKHT